MVTIKNNISSNTMNKFQKFITNKTDKCSKEKMTNIIII